MKRGCVTQDELYEQKDRQDRSQRSFDYWPCETRLICGADPTLLHLAIPFVFRITGQCDVAERHSASATFAQDFTEFGFALGE